MGLDDAASKVSGRGFENGSAARSSLHDAGSSLVGGLMNVVKSNVAKNVTHQHHIVLSIDQVISRLKHVNFVAGDILEP